jgi:hypothetical protein
MVDVLETYYQLKKEGQVNDLEFFMVMMIITGGNAELSTYATGVMLESMPFVVEAEQENVDTMMQKYYNESFRYSHRVLLVSHSQGNLFANRVYDSINPSDYQNYFANVQVASPASRVHASDGTYITGWVDPIINPIPGSMESNADLDDFGGHAFVTAYLDSSDTYTKIVDAIKAQLGVLDTIDSQWSTDKELERGTCDYRITVKHRFDPALEIGEKVYPFAPNQKLYTATNQKSGEVEYVKATCGGTDFMDDWDGKKDNECWMIDNPQEEKIGGESCKDPSLFEVISQTDQNSRNWRVTVKNKETNETITGVFPFNLNGSLYQVESGEWVLASCGGSKILSSWDGQQPNEFYMIDNAQKEKITADIPDYWCRVFVEMEYYNGMLKGFFEYERVECWNSLNNNVDTVHFVDSNFEGDRISTEAMQTILQNDHDSLESLRDQYFQDKIAQYEEGYSFSLEYAQEPYCVIRADEDGYADVFCASWKQLLFEAN